MSTAVKLSPRPRKHKKNENIKQEIVVQVHKQIKSNTSSDNDYANSEDNLDVPKSDKNENYSVVHTPSREISVDGETQISSKILSLIETEMKRDINKHSHFTESRPQSLSFYEDEKVPEELSGNLELLSPEEKKHYRKRKEYSQDVDERNAYNDLYSREPEEMGKKKSRKKKYGDSEAGIGDSREMMIPKEKKKSKKKRRENSPGSNSAKKKHSRKVREDEHQLKTDITLALEELQDDVFENTLEEFGNNKMRKSPRRSDKMFVQRKNKFEETRSSAPLNRQSAQDLESVSNLDKKFSTHHPIDVAILYQKWWMQFSNLCHGLLGGLGLGHWLYIMSNLRAQDHAFLIHYAYYSDVYVGLFYALCVVCIVSILDRMDVGHLQCNDLTEFFKQKRLAVVAIMYILCFLVHLSTASYDEQFSILAYNNHSSEMGQSGGNHSVILEDDLLEKNLISHAEISIWNQLSLWRAAFAFVAWIILGLGSKVDLFRMHLKYMQKFVPDN